MRTPLPAVTLKVPMETTFRRTLMICTGAVSQNRAMSPRVAPATIETVLIELIQCGIPALDCSRSAGFRLNTFFSALGHSVWASGDVRRVRRTEMNTVK